MKITALTQEQCEFVCNTVCKWMNICEDNKRGFGGNDVAHSALLRRMLMGGPVHENPPPKRFSYPSWELVERDEIQISEINESELFGLTIDQHPGYEWVDKDNKILKYTRLGISYQYLEKEITGHGIRGTYKYTGKFLKRLNDPMTGKEEVWRL